MGNKNSGNDEKESVTELKSSQLNKLPEDVIVHVILPLLDSRTKMKMNLVCKYFNEKYFSEGSELRIKIRDRKSVLPENVDFPKKSEVKNAFNLYDDSNFLESKESHLEHLFERLKRLYLKTRHNSNVESLHLHGFSTLFGFVEYIYDFSQFPVKKLVVGECKLCLTHITLNPYRKHSHFDNYSDYELSHFNDFPRIKETKEKERDGYKITWEIVQERRKKIGECMHKLLVTFSDTLEEFNGIQFQGNFGNVYMKDAFQKCKKLTKLKLGRRILIDDEINDEFLVPELPTSACSERTKLSPHFVISIFDPILDPEREMKVFELYDCVLLRDENDTFNYRGQTCQKIMRLYQKILETHSKTLEGICVGTIHSPYTYLDYRISKHFKNGEFPKLKSIFLSYKVHFCMIENSVILRKFNGWLDDEQVQRLCRNCHKTLEDFTLYENYKGNTDKTIIALSMCKKLRRIRLYRRAMYKSEEKLNVPPQSNYSEKLMLEDRILIPKSIRNEILPVKREAIKEIEVCSRMWVFRNEWFCLLWVSMNKGRIWKGGYGHSPVNRFYEMLFDY